MATVLQLPMFVMRQETIRDMLEWFRRSRQVVAQSAAPAPPSADERVATTPAQIQVLMRMASNRVREFQRSKKRGRG